MDGARMVEVLGQRFDFKSLWDGGCFAFFPADDRSHVHLRKQILRLLRQVRIRSDLARNIERVVVAPCERERTGTEKRRRASICQTSIACHGATPTRSR